MFKVPEEFSYQFCVNYEIGKNATKEFMWEMLSDSYDDTLILLTQRTMSIAYDVVDKKYELEIVSGDYVPFLEEFFKTEPILIITQFNKTSSNLSKFGQSSITEGRTTKLTVNATSMKTLLAYRERETTKFIISGDILKHEYVSR